MATNMMYVGEVLRTVVDRVTGARTKEWRQAEARLVGKDEPMRCMHCHGPVRKHDQKDPPNGPKPHFEHLPGQDARTCQGAGAFRSSRQEHKMSATPVT